MKNNYFKKLLSLALVVTLGATLSSCGSSAYNTEAPYGNITGTYATDNGNELTNKQLYDLLRPTGYSVLYNQVEEILLTNYKNEAGESINYLSLDYYDDGDYSAMQQLLIETLFSVDEMEDFNKISDDDFNDFVEKFIDSMYTTNIIISSDDLYRTTSGIQFTTTIFDYFKLNLAKENFSRDRLAEIILKGEEYDEVVKEDGEIVLDSNGDPETETVKNTYWISDEDVENHYNTTYRHGLDYNAIIVGFNTIEECEDAINDATSTYGLVRYFADLYNSAYEYKSNLTYTSGAETSVETFLNNSNNNTNTTINADKLASFNSSLSTFVVDMEAGDYTKTYKEFGGKYYMIYKLTDTTSDEWEDVVEGLSTESDKYKDLFDEVYQDIFDSKLSSSFTSLQISEIIDELFEEEKFAVYDPVFALLFETNFSNYTYEAQTLEDNKNVVKFTYNDIEYKITPEELFEELAIYFGVSTSVSYFTNYAIANSELASNLDADDEDAAQTAFDDELANFKNNAYASNGITSEFTEEQFLSMMFGYDNETDVINNCFMAQQAISYLSEDYSDLFFELLNLTGKNNFTNYFDLNIKHVLLFVDYDLDGTLDNPEDFMAELTADQVKSFEAIITNIYSELYKEATYLNGSVSDNLDRIVRMYNDGDYLSYRRADSTETNYTWDQIKVGANLTSITNYDFKIQIKVETLGTIDNSNASNYVTEFSDHVESMYNKLYTANKEIFDTDNEGKYSEDDLDYTQDLLNSLNDYLDEEHLEFVEYGTTDFDDLCMSSFGFHMLLSTSGSVASNAIFTIDDDRKADYEDDYHIYENIVVTYDDEEYTLDGYSETAWPSLNQLKVYVYETNSDDGIENLKSDTETIINQFYSTFTTRYTDSTFVTYLIYNMLDMDIQFNNPDIVDDMIDTWFEISKKQLDNYTETSSIYAGWWDTIESYNWNA